jgi:hypothetical protein
MSASSRSEVLYRGRLSVGSRTGAVFRRSGLAIAPRFLWECLNSQTVNPFPAPATSHPACGFPALGAPVCFVPRFMGPILLGQLSRLTIDEAGSR